MIGFHQKEKDKLQTEIENQNLKDQININAQKQN
jgi:hypothetical protein